MGFWGGLISKDNTDVHTPYIILMGIATVLMILSVVLIIYHCFIHKKGIDGDTVKLILGLLGGGVLNAGASYFQKTTISSVTGVMGGMPSPGAQTGVKPDAPKEVF